MYQLLCLSNVTPQNQAASGGSPAQRARISMNGGDVWTFHNFYGWLFSITWIISYPLIIIGVRNKWKLKIWNHLAKTNNPAK
jgi:hypothetical protein